jgi:hypothetical protein
VEFDDTTRAVTYYKVLLDCNILSFKSINQNVDKNYFLKSHNYVPIYDKKFTYYLYGDSFKIINIGRISPSYIHNVGHIQLYDVGKVSFYRDKIIISHAKFNIKYYYDKNIPVEYSDTTYYIRTFYKTKFMNEVHQFKLK